MSQGEKEIVASLMSDLCTRVFGPGKLPMDKTLTAKPLSENLTTVKNYLLDAGYTLSNPPTDSWGRAHFHDEGMHGHWPLFEVRQWVRVIGVFELEQNTIALGWRHSWTEGHTVGYYDVIDYAYGYEYYEIKRFIVAKEIADICVAIDNALHRWTKF